jgi:hypothetical protein
MNSHPTLNMLNHPLDRYTEAVRGDRPEAVQADGAQRRLMARIGEAREAGQSPNRGWRWAAAAALAILMVPVLVMMPGSNDGLAFAQVQSYFTGFETMSARMTTRMNGGTVVAMDIAVDERNRTRLDSGEAFSFIIDPHENAMMQLFHQQQLAVRVPIEGAHSHGPAEAMGWLEEIREYQGQARLIDQERTIDGDEVFGFRLTGHAVDMTLWATGSGRPVLLEMQTGPESASAATTIEFSFDQPMDPERFSLTAPAGYSVTNNVDTD